jgi:uncharacterized membrane protein YccC
MDEKAAHRGRLYSKSQIQTAISTKAALHLGGEASMDDFVSTRWIRLVGFVASSSIIGAAFIPYGLPWIGVIWVGVAFSVALCLRARAPRSMAQVIDDIEAEPLTVAQKKL